MINKNSIYNTCIVNCVKFVRIIKIKELDWFSRVNNCNFRLMKFYCNLIKRVIEIYNKKDNLFVGIEYNILIIVELYNLNYFEYILMYIHTLYQPIISPGYFLKLSETCNKETT